MAKKRVTHSPSSDAGSAGGRYSSAKGTAGSTGAQEDAMADAMGEDFMMFPIDYKDAEALASFLKQLLKKVNRPLRMDELLRISKFPRKAKKRVEAALFSLQDRGEVVRSSSGWACPSRLRHVQGVLAVQRSGVGFITPSEGGGPDVYIHPAAMSGAWHGDKVEAVLLPGRRGPNPEGRITRVISRAHKELPVYALKRQKNGQWLCAPVSPRIQALFVTDVSSLAEAVKTDNLLLVQPGQQTGQNLWEAVATVNLEHEDSPAAQERLVKSSYEIPESFPQAVLDSVAGLPPDPDEKDFKGRKDVRAYPFVTIDGRAARDFDDAVYVESATGGFRLLVAIADVSHYVLQGTPLDSEARLRGNSYYFPLSVEPMLPEALSNGLCSLRPDVPRLAMIADLSFSSSGKRTQAAFYEAVIRSHARLTYGQIERGLLLHDREEEETLAPVLPMLRQAEQLARILMAVRKQRGSLDFDIPEAEVQFDEQGNVSGIVPRKRHFGHRLIEEFMIAANEAVAEFLESGEQPTLYRVHEPPDPEKLRALMDFLNRTGLESSVVTSETGAGRRSGKKQLTSAELVRVLDDARGTPREYTVNRLLLRAMMQARYQPDNDGHFGLASSCYCHFTSPIRRYADLVTHRALKLALGLESPGGALSRARLTAVAEHINGTERTAAEAERELTKRLSVLLLRDSIGVQLDGIISGVTDFGIFVELPSVMAEGMIRLASLTDDYYEYLPERQELRGSGSRRIFRIGQELRVEITDVHLARLEINLSLVGESADAPGRGDMARKKRAPSRNRSVSKKPMRRK